MPSPNDYGSYYFCVKVPKTISKDGEIYVRADTVEITPTGDLSFTPRQNDEKNRPSCLLIASGKWIAVYLASHLDGSAVAVEYWESEVNRKHGTD
jgi:hypothetical protein